MTGEGSGCRGAFVGFGNIALLGHLPALRGLGADMVAAVDICEKRRRLAAEEGLAACESLEELEGLDLDFIDICTPPSARYEPISFAVRRGLDVICEKPVATPADFTRIRELVMGSDIFFYPVHNWKHAPHYKKAKEMVEENGGVLSLQMSTLRTGFSHGNPHWRPDWRVDPSVSGGGIIMDHGYHNIYLAMHLMGDDFQQALLEGVEYFEDRPHVERKATFTLLFPGGRKATINLDWGAQRREIKNTIYECNSQLELRDSQIINSDHTYEFEESLSGDSVHGSWFADVFRDFFRLRGSKEKSHFLEAMKVLQGIEDLYRQARG